MNDALVAEVVAKVKEPLDGLQRRALDELVAEARGSARALVRLLSETTADTSGDKLTTAARVVLGAMAELERLDTPEHAAEARAAEERLRVAQGLQAERDHLFAWEAELREKLAAAPAPAEREALLFALEVAGNTKKYALSEFRSIKDRAAALERAAADTYATKADRDAARAELEILRDLLARLGPDLRT